MTVIIDVTAPRPVSSVISLRDLMSTTGKYTAPAHASVHMVVHFFADASDPSPRCGKSPSPPIPPMASAKILRRE